MTQEKKGGIVITDRPMVSVDMLNGEVIVTTASISSDFTSVEHTEIRFPVECAKEVAKAILAVVKK